MTDYDKYPEHPLYAISAEVLKAARRTTHEAGLWGDADSDIAEAIADAVLIDALPAIRAWLAGGLEDRASALRTDDLRTGRASIEYINGVEYAAHYVRDAPKPASTYGRVAGNVTHRGEGEEHPDGEKRSRQVSEPMARAEFAEWLHQLAEAVAAGDSDEGSLEYLLDYGDEGAAGQDTVMVRASVRTGNRMGQGGMIVLGRWVADE